MDISEIRRKKLRSIRDELGGDTALSEVLGKSLSQIGQIIGENYTRNIGSRLARQIEPKIKKPAGWLDSLSPLLNQELADYNVESAVSRTSQVPLISWVAAGGYLETQDLFNVGDSEELIDTGLKTSKNAFALRVRGDSMTSTDGVSFPDGIIIVVEPTMQPEPGDYVIVNNGDNEATFKQLIKDGSDWYLKPLNTRYPMKPLGSSKVIGVVREAIIKLR